MEPILASHIKVHGSYIYKTCTILKVFYTIKQSIQINLKMKVKKLQQRPVLKTSYSSDSR